MTGDSLPHNYDQIFYNSNTNSTGDNQNIKHAINQIPYFNQNRSPAEDSVNSPASSTHSSTINQRSSAISHQHHYQTQYYNHQHHPVPNFASVPDPVAAGSGLGPFDSHPLDFGTISHGMQQQQQQQQQQQHTGTGTGTGTGIGTGNITEAQFNTFPLVTPPTQSVASNPLNTHINSHFGSYISGVPIMEEKEPVSLDSLELPEIPTAEEQMSINNNKYSSNNNNDNNNNNNNNNGSSSSNSNNNNNNNNNIHTPEESASGSEDRSRGGGSKRKHNSPLNGNASQKAAKKTRFRPCDGCRKRKTRCFIPDDKRSCLECSKRGQACEYDNDKIFLFNNINTLSGVSKVVSDGSVVTKFSNESTGNTRGSSASNANANANASTNANANTNTSNKPQRTKPCDGCKRKRSKCIKVDDSSSCMECEKKNIICTYSQNVLNMFPSTGKINLLANHDIGIEKPVKDYSMLNEPTVMSSSLSLLSSQSSTIIGETSIIEKRILNFINNNSNNSNSKNKSKEKQLNAEPSIILDSPIFSIDNKHNTVRKLNDHSVFHVVNDDDDFINLKCLQCDEIEEIVGESNHYLINLYFRLVHNSFPIISKQAYYERYCRNYREIHPLLLVSVYLMALNWWELESHENEKTMKFTKTAVKPDVVKLEKIAISLMQDNIYESPKFSVLQALLLLMNYSFTIPNPYSLSSWKITSLMTSFAEEMGLNWPVSYWGNIPKWECKVRKIVAWSVLFHDKLYSLIEGRSSNIDWKNNWLVDDLNFNDFLIDNDSLKVLQQNDLMQKDEMFRRMVAEEAYDEMEIETSDTNDDKYLEQVIFIQNFKLSKSIDDILKQLYSIRSLQNDDFNAIYSKSVPILADLSQWFESLPETVKLVNSSSSSPGDNDGIIANTGLENKQKDFQRLSLLSNGSLNLLYFTLVILIYKRLITRYIDHLQSNNDGDNNNNVSAEIVEQFTNLKPQIVSVLQTAIYKFLFNLKPFNLEPFWLLSTKRSFVFIGVVISLFAKAVDLEREKTVPMPDNNQSQSIIKTENKENASNNNTTDDGDEGDNESENNSENVNTNANDERCEKLARERVQIVDIYRDFHWKLSIFAPDFNHAQTALLHLNNLVVLKEDANSKDREWRFVL